MVKRLEKGSSGRRNSKAIRSKPGEKWLSSKMVTKIEACHILRDSFDQFIITHMMWEVRGERRMPKDDSRL